MTLWWMSTGLDSFFYPDDIHDLVASANRTVTYHIEEHGEDKLLLLDKDARQSFRHRVFGRVELKVWNRKPYAIAWADMRGLLNLLKGINSPMLFEFAVASGTKIGEGEISYI